MYQTFTRTATSLPPFQLVCGLEEIIPIECEIISLKFVVELLPSSSMEEEVILHMMHLDDTRCDFVMANEAHKKRIKAQYEKIVKPCVSPEGDLILLCDQRFGKLGLGKLEEQQVRTLCCYSIKSQVNHDGGATCF